MSENAIVSASPKPSLAIATSEATLQRATVGRVQSLVEPVEKGIENRDTTKLTKQRMDAFDPHPPPV